MYNQIICPTCGHDTFFMVDADGTTYTCPICGTVFQRFA